MVENRHNNAIIWLQDGEEEGAADCGCRLINDEDGARFLMCDKHETASELFDALNACCSALAKEQLRRRAAGFRVSEDITNAYGAACVAIAKATGEDQ